MVLEILTILSSVFLAIFIGAQLTEAYLLVPYWKSLTPTDFFELHKKNKKRIYSFFAPLTIIATILPLEAIMYGFIYKNEQPLLHILLGIFTLSFFSTYFIYFKKANKSFVEKRMSATELSSVLKTWNSWHWLRIFFQFLALCVLIILLILKA